MTPEEKLKSLGISLTPAPKPLGSYVPAVRAGNMIYLSGILPLRDGKLVRTGKVGQDITIDEAREEAKAVVINALSILREYAGGLDNVKRCVKVNGYISSAPDFTEQPKVLNAASDFLFEIFGEAGRHARAAIGVAVLPLNSPVEIDFVFELKG